MQVANDYMIAKVAFTKKNAKRSAMKLKTIMKIFDEVLALARNRANEAKMLRDKETNVLVKETLNGEYLGSVVIIKDIERLKDKYEESEGTE